MAAQLLNERDLTFLLYEMFSCEQLTTRKRYQDHDKQTFNEVLNTAKTIAEKYFMPIRQQLDVNQPMFDGKQVSPQPELKQAIEAVIESGLSSSTADYERNGMQLPLMVANAANAYLTIAGGVGMGYCMLTNANANLLEAHGSDDLIEKWVKPMRAGRYMGTMAMTEPGCGSGLADITTKAVPCDDGTYRLTGNKIFISGGDHQLSENIVHLVLARIENAPKGIKGISLFVVPKFLVNEDGSLGEQNDVALAGLFHKMGGRAQTSTALSFGEKGGAVGYLVGEQNRGLSYMFHMMNEARIMVGSSAAFIAVAGYQYSLEYAKNRPQGRLPSCKDPLSAPVNIIEHADVKRMLLTQKCYAEGALALVFYGSQLRDDELTLPTEAERAKAHILLDFLTPIIKTWPSEYGPKANSLAIQVLGGHGYINEHPVEMFYRDNRLNAIHEGTTGIQSLDLLARKVPMNNMAGYRATLAEIEQTIGSIHADHALYTYSKQLQQALQVLNTTTECLLKGMQQKSIDLVLANSVMYLSLFGHIIIAWLWLKQGLVAEKALSESIHIDDENFYHGKLQALQFFYRMELPKIEQWSVILQQFDDTHYQMETAWF